MSLSNTQKDMLAAAIRANPLMWTDPDQQNMDNDAIADHFNEAPDNPASVWKQLVSETEFKGAVLVSDIEALSAGKTNAVAFYLHGGSFDATQPNTRQGLATIFEGTQSLDAVMAVCKRPATRLEQLFSQSAGDARISSVYGAVLTPYDVSDALFGSR